jgi:hypothetical protein
VSPEYPPNLLALAEALRVTGDPAGAQRAIEAALGSARRAAASKNPDAEAWVREGERLRGELSVE